ncbi:MAG TPA: hypothetical protein VJ804_12800, partial [Acidimicrobiales bacterium]|nr:hypothetical protein [Acidimicrobiales bacterium]
MPLHPQVQPILDGLAAAAGPRLEDMAPSEAREMFRALAQLAAGAEVARVEDRAIPGPGGEIPLRVYWPTEPAGEPPGVLVWLHGGGWVIGDLDT